MNNLPVAIPLAEYTVIHTKAEGFELQVKVHGKSVNSWNFGFNEEIAQSKTATVIDAYARGLEFVQEQVRHTFAEEEEATKE